MSSVERASAKTIALTHGVVGGRVGLEIPEGITFEQWAEVGQRIGRMADASLWWLADWVDHGAEWEHGDPERYPKAIEATGFAYQTLRNLGAVARKIELSRRRDNLTFGHHEAVCSLPGVERDELLDRAAAQSWSVMRLRQESRSRRLLGGDGGAGDVVVTIFRVSVPKEREARWAAAAERIGMDVQEFIVDAVDRAASELEAAG